MSFIDDVSQKFKGDFDNACVYDDSMFIIV